MKKIKARITNYNNGASVKLPNRRITITENDKNEFYIQFKFADKVGDPNKPACEHVCLKSKVRQTTIKLSEEILESLIVAYTEYKKNQYFNKKYKDKTQAP